MVTTRKKKYTHKKKASTKKDDVPTLDKKGPFKLWTKAQREARPTTQRLYNSAAILVLPLFNPVCGLCAAARSIREEQRSPRPCVVERREAPLDPLDTLELARFKWNRIFSLPYQRSFHNTTGSYFMKDDHDLLKNDCWPGQTYGKLTFEQGLALFREQVPMGEKTYRTIRWGKDLQVWLVEGRDFRNSNTMPDGPEKTLWGEAQKQWFFDTVKKSDATFRILISPTPIVGPDRKNKNDNHANAGFACEGDVLRSFIGKQKNMFIICGDRHWQYVSEDPETGAREYSCGSTSDQHASGFREEDRSPMHHYLKVKKGGFLAVAIEPNADGAQAILTHHGVDGTVFNQETLIAE